MKKINGGNKRSKTGGLESDFIDKLDNITSCIWVIKKKSTLAPVLNQLNGCKIEDELQVKFHFSLRFLKQKDQTVLIEQFDYRT